MKESDSSLSVRETSENIRKRIASIRPVLEADIEEYAIKKEITWPEKMSDTNISTVNEVFSHLYVSDVKHYPVAEYTIIYDAELARKGVVVANPQDGSMVQPRFESPVVAVWHQEKDEPLRCQIL